MRLKTNRPGVYSEYTISCGNTAKDMQKVCALILFDQEFSTAVYAGRRMELHSLEQFYNTYRFHDETQESVMLFCASVKTLFECGAQKIYTCLASNTKELHTCIEEMEFCVDVDIELLYSKDSSHIFEFKNHLEAMASCRKERIGIVTAETIELAKELASSFPSERLVVVGQKSRLVQAPKMSPMSGFSTALAVACEVLQKENPVQNLNHLNLEEISEFEPIGDALIEECLVCGVSVLEQIGNKARCIKVLTTKSRTSQHGDTTFENLATTLTVDFMMQAIRGMLDELLCEAKTNGQTIEKISSQLIILLGNFVDKEVLTSFENPKVYLSSKEQGVCIIELKFAVACAINQICLTAQIVV